MSQQNSNSLQIVSQIYGENYYFWHHFCNARMHNSTDFVNIFRTMLFLESGKNLVTGQKLKFRNFENMFQDLLIRGVKIK